MTSRTRKFFLRSAPVLAAFVGLAACSDSSTGPTDRLDREQVASLYAICTLVFEPAGGVLPSVDIAKAAFEFPGGFRNPHVGLDPDPQQTAELKFVPTGYVNDREIRGNYEIQGMERIALRFDATAVDPKSLLIPENRWLAFEFQENPRRLTMEASPQYAVARSDYLGLTGLPFDNIPASITGVLRADLRSDGCGG